MTLLAIWPAMADEAVLAKLRMGGKVIMLRHATAPGTGDPADFRLEDCATQRNLSETGRVQARRIGEALADWKIPIGRVLSSRWCRALETARLAFGDSRVEPFASLDSFFGDRGEEPARTAAVRMLVSAYRGPGNLVLVTHQVNITALTGIVPAQGEAVILAPGVESFSAEGRLSID